MAVVALSMAILANSASHVLFKHSLVTQKLSMKLVAVLLFAIVPGLVYLALKNLSLSTVYMSTSLTQVLILLAAKFLFHEMINTRKIVAISLIILGILIFNFGYFV